jgi:hypothetical protein
MRTSLLVVLALSFTFGCGGDGAKESEDAGAEADVRAEDVGDLQLQEIGPASAACPHGTVSSGNGCYLPCEDGWHDGADGKCHMDCPALTAVGDDGECTGLACPDGWSEAPDGMQICVRKCPAGFESDPSWGGHGCRLPCSDGMTRGDDGWCHLDCPAGMQAADTASGCELVQAGGSMECPGGKWHVDPTADNPLYVEAGADEETADGTEDAPFPTIMAAVAFAQEQANQDLSLFVAEGDYHENVFIEGFKSVTLLGVCPQLTRVIGEGLGDFESMGLGAISVLEAMSVDISGLGIVSDKKGIFVYRDKDAGSLMSVHNVHIEESGSSGMMVIGRFEEFQIVDNTVSHATSYGIGVANDEGIGGLFPATVNIVGNVITQMDHCQAEFCADIEYSVGMIVLYATDVTIEGNYLGNIDQVQGMYAAFADNIVVRGNLFENLAGSDALVVDGTDVVIEDNRIAGCVAGEFNGQPPNSFRGIVGNTSMTGKPMAMTLRRNLLEDIQGFAMLVVTAQYPNQEASVLAKDNEVVDSAAGIYYSSGGYMKLEGNRFAGTRVGAFQARSVETSAEGNVFRDGVNHDFELPAGDDKAVIAGNDISVSLIMIEGQEPVRFSGNHAVNVANLTEGLGGATVAVGQTTLAEVADNLFEECWASTILMVSGYNGATISDNVFIGVDSNDAGLEGNRDALLVGSENLDGPTTLTVEGNYLVNFMTSGKSSPVSLVFEHDEVEVRFAENVMRNIRLAYIIPAGNTVIDSIDLSGNSFHGTLLYLSACRKLIMEDNYLWASIVLFSKQPLEGTAAVRGNLFNDARVEVRIPPGKVMVEGNEFSDSYQVGLLVVSAWHAGDPETYPPDVHISHNIFNGVREGPWKWGSVGTIADALQITGTSEFPSSGVTVSSNRFHDCERFGAIISSSGAMMEGNMFAKQCPLVIQNEVGATPVTGSDVDFAERPESPFGVVTIDDMMLTE